MSHPGTASDPKRQPGDRQGPGVLVVSSLFPHEGRPSAGLFVQERMFRVARQRPAVFVVPVPWFPLQGLVRRLRPGFRPPAPRYEERDGHTIHFPRFLSVPGVLKSLDGFFMGLALSRWWRRQRRSERPMVDAHFGYPDGVAAMGFARRDGLPFCVTLRGNEFRYIRLWWCRPQLQRLLRRAARVFTVSSALRELAVRHGAPSGRVQVVPNGVDAQRFRPLDREAERARLGLSGTAPVIITVGWLIERKGQHRVIEALPALRRRFPDITYLVIGETLNEPGYEAQLRERVAALGVDEHVRFLGAMAPDELSGPLSAADVFVLATRREGWANVLLEAMACGLPVVTTDIPGNSEVIEDGSLGRLVPFGDPEALVEGINEALNRDWDRDAIIEHARANGWERRIEQLVTAFDQVAGEAGSGDAGVDSRALPGTRGADPGR